MTASADLGPILEFIRGLLIIFKDLLAVGWYWVVFGVLSILAWRLISAWSKKKAP